MEDLYSALGPLNSQPECRTCRLCEEHVGLVYLLGDEATKAGRHGLPVLTTSRDVQYLGRTPEGWCCSFDPATNSCRIYSDRPLCCRIYPLDLMRLSDEVWWVVHAECPIAQRCEREKGLGLFVAITVGIERLISNGQLEKWLVQDRFSQMIEAFSGDLSNVIKLRKYGDKGSFPRLLDQLGNR